MNHMALVPMNVLQASPSDKVKVGEERVVKVMAIHGDECEIMYAPKKEGDGDDMEGDEYGMDADSEIDHMAKE